MMETRQIDTEFTVEGVTYPVHLTMSPAENGFFRTNYLFKFSPEDERPTMFYCLTSENPEVVFGYIIEAREICGDDWKKRLKFNHTTKQLFFDEHALPV